MAFRVSRDVERRAKRRDISTEEVWRPHDPAGLTLTPFLPHSFVVFGIDITHTMCVGHVDEDILARNVASPLEEGVTQRQTHGFPHAVTLAVGGGGQRQGRQRGSWEVAGVKLSEEVRDHLRSQGIYVLRRRYGVEWLPVDQFEWPRSHSQDNIVTSQLIPPLNNHAKSHVSKGAADVRVHFNYRHDRTPCRQLSLHSRGSRSSGERSPTIIM